jgi:hypothetical protein
MIDRSDLTNFQKIEKYPFKLLVQLTKLTTFVPPTAIDTAKSTTASPQKNIEVESQESLKITIKSL